MKKFLALLILLFALGTGAAVTVDVMQRGEPSSPVTAAPAKPLSPQESLDAHISKLIAQLADPNPAVRAAAGNALQQLGDTALPQLRAINSNSDEMNKRIESVIQSIVPPAGELALEMQAPLKPEAPAAEQQPAEPLLNMGMPGQRGAGMGQLGAMDPNQLAQLQAQMQRLNQLNAILGRMGGMGGLGLGGGRGRGGLGGGLGGLGGGMMGGLGGLGGGLGGLGGGGQQAQLQAQLNQLMQQQANPQALQGMLGVQPGGGRRQAGPLPELPESLSINLLASFGVRLGEAADGVRVTDIKAGSPAANLGVRVGDVINKLNGRATEKLDDARDFFAANLPITQIEITRRGETLILSPPKP